MLLATYPLIIVTSSCSFIIYTLSFVSWNVSPFVSYYVVAIPILFWLYVLFVLFFHTVCWVADEPYVECILDCGFKICPEVPVSPSPRASNPGLLGILNKRSIPKLHLGPSSSLGLEVFNSVDYQRGMASTIWFGFQFSYVLFCFLASSFTDFFLCLFPGNCPRSSPIFLVYILRIFF